MTTKLIDRNALLEFKSHPSDIPFRDVKIQKAFAGVSKAINPDERTIEFVISTAAVDRDGDTINVNGWDFKAYKKNPVVLFAHDANSPPIGKSIDIKVDGDALVSTAQFAEHELAQTIFDLYKGGFMNATSVGFMPTRMEFVDSDDRFGIDFIEQELLEYSAVPVPANPEALIAASASVDMRPLRQWAEKILDTGGGLLIPRDQIEAFYKTIHPDHVVIHHLSPRAQLELRLRNLLHTVKVDPDDVLEDLDMDALLDKSIQGMIDKLVALDDDAELTVDEAIEILGIIPVLCIVLDDETHPIKSIASEYDLIDDSKTETTKTAETKEARETGPGGEDGHRHSYDDSESGVSGETEGHVHPVTLNADGSITIEDAEGHGHPPAAANAPEEEALDPDAAKDELPKDFDIAAIAIGAMREELSPELWFIADGLERALKEKGVHWLAGAINTLLAHPDDDPDPDDDIVMQLIDDDDELLTLSQDLVDEVPAIIAATIAKQVPELVEIAIRRARGEVVS